MVLDQKLRAYILSTSWRESEAGPHAGFWNLKAYSTDTPLQTKLYLLRHPKIVLPTSYSSIQTYEITGTILIQTSTLLFFFILLFAITNYVSAWEQVFIETRVGYPGARVTDNYKLPDLSARGGGGWTWVLWKSNLSLKHTAISQSLRKSKPWIFSHLWHEKWSAWDSMKIFFGFKLTHLSLSWQYLSCLLSFCVYFWSWHLLKLILCRSIWPIYYTNCFGAMKP